MAAYELPCGCVQLTLDAPEGGDVHTAELQHYTKEFRTSRLCDNGKKALEAGVFTLYWHLHEEYAKATLRDERGAERDTAG